MSKEKEKNKNKISEKGKAWLKREMRPYRAAIFRLAAYHVCATISALAFAFFIRFLINGAAQADKKKLLIFSGLILAALAARIFFQLLGNYFSEKTRSKIYVALRGRLFLHLLHARYDETEKYHSGDLLNRITSDVREVAADSVGILPAVAGMTVQCVGAVGVLFSLDPLFTCIFIAGSCAMIGLSALLKRKMKKYHAEILEADGKSRAFIQESLSASLTLKAYGAEEKAAEKSRGILSAYYRKRMSRNKLNATVSASFSLLGNIGMVFAVIWCGAKILSGSSDYGAVLSVVLLLQQLQGPVLSFSSILPVCYARAASGERLAEIDELPEDEQFSARNSALSSDFGENCEYSSLKGFEVKDLSFAYADEKGKEKRAVFEGANAFIKKGEIVCITGGSGSGKSTLFKLLLSVYAPQEGGVYAVTEDERRLPLTAKTRGLFAYVPQGNFLFSGSIGENLFFFSEESDSTRAQGKVEEALNAACAEFVWQLPEGLNTSLRERGGGLSEGQLQRLAVARALLSDRPVLLLDEATSALDGETEKRLLQNIAAMRDKTCIIVTHRPAALALADRVLHVEEGRIIDRKVEGK